MSGPQKDSQQSSSSQPSQPAVPNRASVNLPMDTANTLNKNRPFKGPQKPKKYQGYDRVAQSLRHIATAVYEQIKADEIAAHPEDRDKRENPVEIQVSVVNGELHIASNHYSDKLEEALRKVFSGEAPKKQVGEKRKDRHIRKIKTLARSDQSVIEEIKDEMLKEIYANKGCPAVVKGVLEKEHIVLQAQVGMETIYDRLREMRSGNFGSIVIHKSLAQNPDARAGKQKVGTMHAEQLIENYVAENKDEILQGFREQIKAKKEDEEFKQHTQKYVEINKEEILKKFQREGDETDDQLIQRYVAENKEELKEEFLREKEEREFKLYTDSYIEANKEEIRESPWAKKIETKTEEEFTARYVEDHTKELLEKFQKVKEAQRTAEKMIIPMAGRLIPCAICHEVETQARKEGGAFADEIILLRSSERVGAIYPGRQHIATQTISEESIQEIEVKVEKANRKASDLSENEKFYASGKDIARAGGKERGDPIGNDTSSDDSSSDEEDNVSKVAADLPYNFVPAKQVNAVYNAAKVITLKPAPTIKEGGTGNATPAVKKVHRLGM